MSELPQIDPAKVAQKLISKNGDLTYQVTTLEVLAEALRDERDEAINRVTELEQELASRAEPVADISSLPAER
jgi:hypothetical protein